ncbi:hypothetical protein, unlikely [Trypanosoma brucei gambiense DAL972]|uniref:Uncharacterized protein n=1 Tax=Trypanosoma brucei gambiense (strain MHOM/CI/86/DAL972) TaxID=679716 RepID=C9ZXJ3_TRYB9|nr:hypothetical protein, unlikely [Trypanosoma brucei gambiense DAL972]CBH14137.1 hypothetical protein, unlikely [Trypanosoma brucei gambiense DAL972]|eukprot:XP_011776408.1 hypothetical protein, unlikely [Trypanosoma brucei gambiense DAL972]
MHNALRTRKQPRQNTSITNRYTLQKKSQIARWRGNLIHYPASENRYCTQAPEIHPVLARNKFIKDRTKPPLQSPTHWKGNATVGRREGGMSHVLLHKTIKKDT